MLENLKNGRIWINGVDRKQQWRQGREAPRLERKTEPVLRKSLGWVLEGGRLGSKDGKNGT